MKIRQGSNLHIGFQGTLANIGIRGEAAAIASELYESVKDSQEFDRWIHQIDSGISFQTIEQDICLFADSHAVNRYALALTVIVAAADIMKRRFADKNIEEGIFWDSLRDLSYKNAECFAVYGVYGTFVFTWYERFFRAERFQLNRLQFEYGDFRGEDTEIDGVSIRHGQKVIHIHIPSAGPLMPDAVEDSLRRGAELLGEDQKTVVFACGSWLLFPAYKKLFKPGSNLLAFSDRFQLISVTDQAEFQDAWRVFGKTYASVDALPEDTSLRRNFKKYMQAGGRFGTAYGVIVYRR